MTDNDRAFLSNPDPAMTHADMCRRLNEPSLIQATEDCLKQAGMPPLRARVTLRAYIMVMHPLQAFDYPEQAKEMLAAARELLPAWKAWVATGEGDVKEKLEAYYKAHDAWKPADFARIVNRLRHMYLSVRRILVHEQATRAHWLGHGRSICATLKKLGQLDEVEKEWEREVAAARATGVGHARPMEEYLYECMLQGPTFRLRNVVADTANDTFWPSIAAAETSCKAEFKAQTDMKLRELYFDATLLLPLRDRPARALAAFFSEPTDLAKTMERVANLFPPPFVVVLAPEATLTERLRTLSNAMARARVANINALLEKYTPNLAVLGPASARRRVLRQNVPLEPFWARLSHTLSPEQAFRQAAAQFPEADGILLHPTARILRREKKTAELERLISLGWLIHNKLITAAHNMHVQVRNDLMCIKRARLA